MPEPIKSTGTNVKGMGESVLLDLGRVQVVLHNLLKDAPVDPVEFVKAIGRVLPLISNAKETASEIVVICEKEAIRARKK